MKHIAFLVLLFVTDNCYSQNLQCPDIAKTLKEYQIDSSSNSYLGAVFTQHCQSDGSRKSSGAGVGLDVIVKNIPVGLTGNYTSNGEAFTNFCKTYSALQSSFGATDSYKQTISQKALETVERCLEFQSSGVVVTHAITNNATVNFYLKASVINRIEITGVHIDGPVVCNGNVSGVNKVFDQNLTVKVSGTQGFACSRKPTSVGSTGDLRFQESVITLLTNQGNYSVFWPQEDRLTESSATSINKRLKDIENELSIAKSTILKQMSEEIEKYNKNVVHADDKIYLKSLNIGEFARHQNGVLRISPNDNTALFEADRTWIVIKK